MKIELQNYLKKKFPELYSQNLSFDCNNGWFRIILWLSRYLQMYISQQNEISKKLPQYYQPVKQIVAIEIKQKFGTLKFNCDGGNEHTNSIISFVEFISGYICETTGKLDNIGYNSKNFIETLHMDLIKDKNDFKFVDDEELRIILKNHE